ncbi:MAG: hypothetical protein EOP06_14500, partial [Proteobacteria bacterium]
MKRQSEKNGHYQFLLECSTLEYTVSIKFPNEETQMFHYQTHVSPKVSLLLPFWPKDILPLNKNGQIRNEGVIHTHQVGTRSGILFFNDGQAGSVFYFQNLTSLNDYCQDTETSAKDIVGGQWPEIGFSLPAAIKPIEKGKTYCISEAFVRLDSMAVTDPSEVSRRYLDHLAETYLIIPRPDRHYHNWLVTVERGLHDLLYHNGCWTFAGGHTYLNAYVSD